MVYKHRFRVSAWRLLSGFFALFAFVYVIVAGVSVDVIIFFHFILEIDDYTQPLNCTSCLFVSNVVVQVTTSTEVGCCGHVKKWHPHFVRSRARVGGNFRIKSWRRRNFIPNSCRGEKQLDAVHPEGAFMLRIRLISSASPSTFTRR